VGERGRSQDLLEALAAHRGSVLGNLPDEPQPAQKMFESLIWKTLAGFDAARPIHVEAESRKIGELRVPEALIEAMWNSECVVLEAPLEVRVGLLQHEYAHFLDRPEILIARLECLTALHGHAVINQWKELARARRWDELTGDLLVRHYDPAYTRAIVRHYPALARAARLELRDTGASAFHALARRCLARDGTPEKRHAG